MSRCVSGYGESGGLTRIRVFSQILGGKIVEGERVNGNLDVE